MFHPDDQARAWSIWSHSLQTGEPYEVEDFHQKHKHLSHGQAVEIIRQLWTGETVDYVGEFYTVVPHRIGRTRDALDFIMKSVEQAGYRPVDDVVLGRMKPSTSPSRSSRSRTVPAK